MTRSKLFNTFDLFQIFGLTACVIVQAIVSGEFQALPVIAAITGVVNIVLICKANLWNYLFGLITVVTYAIVAFSAHNYGVAIINGLLLAPLQFHGYFQWRKRGADLTIENGEATQVDARRLSWKQRAYVLAASAVLITAVSLILRFFDASAPFYDSTSTIMYIVGQLLMNYAFMEQYFIWIIVNVASVIMWSITTTNGDPQGPVMIIMWSFYLLNSVYGLINWLSLSKK